MNEEGTRTPLYGAQRALGADFTVGLGWLWAKNFGDASAEYEAVRSRVGLWDASPHTKWEFLGAGATTALDRIFTRDLTHMDVGRVCYGPFCDHDGKMLGDGTVFRFADDHFWLVTAPGTESDLEHFEQLTGDLDVKISKRTTDLPQLGINGPGSRELLAPLCNRDLSSLPYYRFWPEQVEIGGVSCWISRSGYSGELGYELFFAPHDGERLWELLTAAGARPYGLDAIEWIRIESGLIAMGADFLPRETSPFDVSLDRFINLNKRRYSGKAALEIEARDPANQLVTLIIDGELPPAGAAVICEGAGVGTLTSPCVSPALGKVISLAIVRREALRSGGPLQVVVEAGAAAAAPAPLSIIDPDKRRPRA
ncbi:MAG TPA: aminomethyltransferase family protein [Candidatus Dormibacteraeota bacterium]|nr:aminomethyltransferase family protein [Candidatus Dormibacteraeota bacterium]